MLVATRKEEKCSSTTYRSVLERKLQLLPQIRLLADGMISSKIRYIGRGYDGEA